MESKALGKWPQTRDPYRKVVPTERGRYVYKLGPLWTIKGPYRQLGAHADKGPLHKCAPTD